MLEQAAGRLADDSFRAVAAVALYLLGVVFGVVAGAVIAGVAGAFCVASVAVVALGLLIGRD